MMLLSQKDVKAINGHWVLSKRKWSWLYNHWKQLEFCKSERSFFVSRYRFTGLYYDHGSYNTWEEFAFKFNHYHEGDKKDARFYRLLTSKELDFINRGLNKITTSYGSSWKEAFDHPEKLISWHIKLGNAKSWIK